MNDNLTVQDPLADWPVTILISLDPDSPSRAGRTATVTVGVQGEPPVFKRGAFGDVVALIHEAWLVFGVRQQVAAVARRTVHSETIAEVVVAEEAVIEHGPDADAGAMPSSPDTSLPSRPQPENLSLF